MLQVMILSWIVGN